MRSSSQRCSRSCTLYKSSFFGLQETSTTSGSNCAYDDKSTKRTVELAALHTPSFTLGFVSPGRGYALVITSGT